MNKLVLAVLCAAGALAPSAASAATTIIQAFDNGWYDQNGIHNPTLADTFTGFTGGDELRSFYAFDVSAATTATSASITFYANGLFFTDGTPLGSVTAGLFDYVGSIDALIDGTGGTAAFSDLRTGTAFGLRTIFAPNFMAMPEFTIFLPPSFVMQFNSALGSSDRRIALGVSALTGVPGDQPIGFWAGSSRLPAAYLTITSVDNAVPEPGTWAMMIVGFGLVGGALRVVERKKYGKAKARKSFQFSKR